MTKSPITLQELRRRIYVKAKAEKSWRFLRQGFGWKRSEHVNNFETLASCI